MSSLPVGQDRDEPQAGAADLAEAFRQHGGWLLAFLRRRFGAHQAEDLAQETFARAARAGQLNLRNPRAFLARVAVSAARDAARRQAVRPRLAPELPDHAAPAQGGGQDQALLLKQLILSLPPQLKEVFLLSRFGGLTYEEIAQRCRISPKTVEARMSKALALCAQRLRDETE